MNHEAEALHKTVLDSDWISEIVQHAGDQFVVALTFEYREDALAFRQAVLDIYNPTDR